MSVFQYNETDDEGENESHMVSVHDNGVEDYITYRMTIPKELAESQNIDENDILKVKKTENGFEAVPINT